MCETWDVLIFLIMVYVHTNVDIFKELSNHSLVVRCIINGNTKQFLTQIEIHKRIEDVIAEILTCVSLVEDIEFQETVI